MSYRNLISWLTVFFWLTIGAAIAQQEVPELIEFDGAAFDEGGGSDIYPSAFTGPVKFSHSRHVEEYDAVCGDCHHDSDFEPIDAHDPDETYACVECHDFNRCGRNRTLTGNAANADKFRRTIRRGRTCIVCWLLVT